MKLLIFVLVSIFCINASAQFNQRPFDSETFTVESIWSVGAVGPTVRETNGMAMMTIGEAYGECREAHLACLFTGEDRNTTVQDGRTRLTFSVEFTGIKTWRVKASKYLYVSNPSVITKTTVGKIIRESVRYEALVDAYEQCENAGHELCVLSGIHFTSENSKHDDGYITSANATVVGAKIRSNN